jgi:hypothetical protein
MLLSKSQILAANDLPTQDVDVPEWGGTVRVRGMTGKERDAFIGSINTGKGKPNVDAIQARLLSIALVNEDGTRMFSDAEMDALQDKFSGALDEVFLVAQKLSRLTPASADELGNGSSGTPNAGSTSDSL